jgi:hypothetical protein
MTIEQELEQTKTALAAMTQERDEAIGVHVLMNRQIATAVARADDLQSRLDATVAYVEGIKRADADASLRGEARSHQNWVPIREVLARLTGAAQLEKDNDQTHS